MISLLARDISYGEGAFYAGFGFLFVFLGIGLLVVIFTILGVIMKKINARPPKKRKIKVKKEKKAKGKKQPVEVPSSEEEALDPETIAVISAAIAAIYQQENAKCDFVVRRIKKL